MIEYLIFDQKRRLWINLELYFKSYKFLICRDFSRIFLNFSEFIIFDLFRIFQLKKSFL